MATIYSVLDVASRYKVLPGAVHQWIFRRLLKPSGTFGGRALTFTEGDLRAFEHRKAAIKRGPRKERLTV